MYAVPAYDPDSQLSMSALYRLEAAGIKVVTTLAGIHKHLTATAGIFLNDYIRSTFSTCGPEECVEAVISNWLYRRCSLPPTWRSLLDVMRSQGLEELAEEIEIHLIGKVARLRLLMATGRGLVHMTFDPWGV